MTTVMTWSNSVGLQGRCDAKFHKARGVSCGCMCGGRYHGAANRPGGLEEAVRRSGEELLELARARAAAAGFELQAKRLTDILAELARPPTRLRGRRIVGQYELPLRGIR